MKQVYPWVEKVSASSFSSRGLFFSEIWTIQPGSDWQSRSQKRKVLSWKRKLGLEVFYLRYTCFQPYKTFITLPTSLFPPSSFPKLTVGRFFLIAVALLFSHMTGNRVRWTASFSVAVSAQLLSKALPVVQVWTIREPKSSHAKDLRQISTICHIIARSSSSSLLLSGSTLP